MLYDEKIKWVMYLAILVAFYMLISHRYESFTTGCYPAEFQNYEMLNDWDKYWSTNSSDRLEGLPDFSNAAEASYKLKDHEFYPLPIGNKYKALGF